ncbi:MAG: adenylate/guanylate cyclase domain-containing protein [Rhodospirillaceae bacterium]
MQDGGANSASDRGGIPLAVILLAVVTLLVGAVSGAVIYENYRRGVQTAMDVGHQLFDNLRTEIAVQQQQLVQPLEAALAILERSPALGRKLPAELDEAFFTVLESNPQITELRIAYDDGDAFAIANLGGADGRLRSAIAAPDEARFVGRRTANGEITWIYIAADHTPLGSFSTPIPEAVKSLVPAWFAAAKRAPGRIAQTKADLIPSLHAAGVTFAIAFSGARPGVIATDVSLGQLSQLLASLKSGDDDQIFIFDADNTLLASPDLDPVMEKDNGLVLGTTAALPSPVVGRMIDKFRGGGPFALATLDVAGERYLSSVIAIGAEDPDRPATYLGLAIPDVTFTGSLIDVSRESVLISLLILLAAIPVVVLTARRLARPLARLQEITDGIARLDLTQDIRVPTRIAEVARLSSSIAHMRNALGEVAKFVPKTLVTDLLRSGRQLRVEGERRELTLVFTDVRNFTPMVEAAAPDDLMAQMSEYFDALAGAILAHRGTIDKYIGDAVFAFWNAPVADAQHALRACEAVLACRDASNVLNTAWAAAGRPAWQTGFSVHLGEAVVGNVGSRDRLNYTAIGNAVNMAARLEGLTRFYDTAILASAAVVEAVGNAMRFRPVDLVLPKGATQPLMIYELLGSSAAPGDEARIAAWRQFHGLYAAREWRRAYAAIIDFTDAYPADRLGEIFRERITAFLAAPPPPTWDGVTRFEEK